MKLSQLLFWILETQDFPTNVHLEPNLGMMGVQKKCVHLWAWAPDYRCLFSKTNWFFCIRTQHTLTHEHQLSNRQAIDTRDGGEKTFLRWKNVGGGATLYEGQNSPQKTGFIWGKGGGGLASSWRRTGHTAGRSTVSQNGSGEGGLARARLETTCGRR